MCQRITSHPSLFLIVFVLVCTVELVYLQEVTFHQLKGCDFSLAVFPQFHSSATQSIKSEICAKIYYLYLLSGQILCFFSLFSGSVFFFFGFHSGFSLPTFLSCVSSWSATNESSITAQNPGPNLPLSLCLPMYVFLCLRLQLGLPAPIAPPISPTTVPVSWRPATHTQFPFTY
ncbi:hypothetical protein GOODEAATRI_014552 [Goodea atripinnis]|uniref:Secreted protein n=1 Tax=Goodea atripinnis TaxID=208336 RepID=A0ABV0PE50_9TELE